MVSRRNFMGALAAAPALSAAGLQTAWSAVDGSRVALVVGNNAYPVERLDNPVNDAQAMAGLFSTAGMAVDRQLDASRDQLLAAIERFGDSVRRPETRLAIFYYAGHGVQLDWRNYLLPVDADVRSAGQIKDRCVDLGVVLGKLKGGKDKTFVIILDACRNDPFGGRFRPERKGLSQFDAPGGSLLAYSTSPGNVASDGVGKNGLYTEHLVRELSLPGTRLEDALKRVRLNVRLQSKGEQIPWESTSLESDVFIFGQGGRTLSEAELEKEVEEDLSTWMRIKSSNRLEDWAAYLRRFPNGRFAEVAQERLARLLTTPGTVKKQREEFGGGIDIKPGGNLAALWRPSENPYSAGRYPLGRRYSVGDVAVMRAVDILTGLEEGVQKRWVTQVDEENDRVEFNDGARISDLMGNPVSGGDRVFDYPVQIFPAELQIGKKWRALFNGRKGGRESGGYLDMQVAARERISVPAGEIETFRIEGWGYNSMGGRMEERRWVVPGLNSPIRAETVIKKPRGGFGKSQRLELVSLRQRHVEQF